MKLADFLVEAKAGTYASQGEGGEKISNTGCKKLVFKKDDLEYQDRYYGTNPFIGEELVYKEDKVIWVMNYCGGITSLDINIKELYEFLKKAMSRIKSDRPFRGPSEYTDDDYRYIDSSNGDIDNFTGVEEILYKGKTVYSLTYHGCSVK